MSTRSQLRSKVIRNMDEEAIPVRWTATEINFYLEDAYRTTCRETGILSEHYSMPVEKGQHFLDNFPKRILYPLAARTIDGNDRVILDPVHWSTIQRIDANFLRSERTSPGLFSGWGLRKVMLDAAFDRPVILEWQIVVTPNIEGEFNSDNSIPKIPDEFHDALASYATGRCYLKDADGPQLGRALRWFKDWKRQVAGAVMWKRKQHNRIRRDMYSQPHRTVRGAIGGFDLFGIGDKQPPSVTHFAAVPGVLPGSAP